MRVFLLAGMMAFMSFFPAIAQTSEEASVAGYQVTSWLDIDQDLDAISGYNPAPILVQNAGRAARSAAPNVYLFRGFLGVFSTGLDSLAAKLRAQRINVKVMSHAGAGRAMQEIEQEYARQRKRGRRHRVVLVGHSLGANAALTTAARLGAKRVPVSMVVTIDGTIDGPVVGSVGRYLNYHTSEGGFGGPLKKPSGALGRRVTNVFVKTRKEGDLRSLNHFNIEKNPRVQAELVRAISRLVPKQRRRS